MAAERLGLVAAALQRVGDLAERRAHAVDRVPGQLRDVGRAEPHARAGRQRAEEALRVESQAGERERRRVDLRDTRRRLDVARQARDRGEREPQPERLRRRVLEPVRLVEHHQVVLRQDADVARARRAQREVGEVQRVVDEDDVGLAGPRPRGLGEAARALGALRAAAAIGPDRELAPDRAGRQMVELVAVARLRRAQPGVEPRERVGLVELDAHPRLRQLRAADVRGAPLHDRRPELAARRDRGERDVVPEQLILERLRRRRDDDAPARERGGHEVREALADARAGLGDEVPLAGERERDGLGEPHLPGAPPEARQHVDERGGIPEMALGREHAFGECRARVGRYAAGMGWQLVFFLHLLAAAIWIGGQVTVFAVAPLIRQTAGDREREILGAVGRAFGGISGVALLVLLVTGLAQADRFGWSASDPFGSETSRLISEKLFLVILMVGLSAAHAVIGVRVARGTLAGGARKGVRALSVLNLLLGLGALWIAADLGT